MKTPEINSIDDLIANESFRKWIVEKDENEAIIWNQWIGENPSRIEWVATAKVMIVLLTGEATALPDTEVDAETERIHERIRASRVEERDNGREETNPREGANGQEGDHWRGAGFSGGPEGRGELRTEGAEQKDAARPGRLFRLRSRWIAAASLLIALAGVTTILFKKNTGPAAPGNAYETFLQDAQNKSIEYNNGTDSVQRILLSDGSEVLLEKNSQLSYAANFNSGKREVYLNGSAFFTVVRDPIRPFIVYTQRIVTRVLGTSFRVNARAGEKIATVIVRTGKVSVFSRENFRATDLGASAANGAANGAGNGGGTGVGSESGNGAGSGPGIAAGPGAGNGAGSGALKGIVLTPNQEMIYDIGKEQMSKTLAEAPVVTKDSVSDFVFDDTPAGEVFRKLQEAYGITILLDEEVMASCSVSASLGNEPFYEKLNMICRIINATYQVIDGNVVINAKGCRGGL